ncbi:MAG: hypothetical protein ACJ8GJ_17775 [Vitreoscilla sp.]
MITSASQTFEPAALPWWRFRIVWLVVGLPAAAVMAATASGVIALHGADPVVPEYGIAAHQAAEESLTRDQASRVPAELARNHAATPRH